MTEEVKGQSPNAATANLSMDELLASYEQDLGIEQTQSEDIDMNSGA